MALTFQPAPPLPLPGPSLPPLADAVGDYAFGWDPRRKLLVYAPRPQAHQLRSVHGWDGERWTEIPSPHYRLGSQAQPWRVVWDPRREALLAWSFDSAAPVGVVLGAPGAILGGDVARFGEDEVGRIATDGDHPRPAEDSEWDGLVGIFGVDEDRGVTVCLTAAAVYELDGVTWRRCASAKGLPKQVTGATSFHQSPGFGSSWDAKRGRLLFWMHDGEDDVPRVYAWRGGALEQLRADGLPEDIWGWSSGYAVAPHPEHGLVVYVGPAEDEGWFALDGERFRVLPAPTGDAPPRTRGAIGGFDAGRGEVVLGPVNHDDTDQQIFYFGDAATGRWRLVGAKRQPCGLKSLSSFPSFWFGVAGGAAHAVDQYLTTARFDEAEGWRLHVSGDAADKARHGKRTSGVACAWGGLLHAVLSDGALVRLDGDTWREVSAPDEEYKGGETALVAFDAARQILVAWGPRKAKGGRKDEAWVHDGKAWSKVKKPKTKLGADDNWSLLYDPARGGVVRVGITELGVFDGATWEVTKLKGKAPERIFVSVAAHGGAIHILDFLDGRLLKIEGNRVALVDEFAAPAPREQHENSKADFAWFDPAKARFVLHMKEDSRLNFAVAV